MTMLKLIYTLAVLGLLSCNSSRKMQQTTISEQSEATTPASRFIVSFISIGTGTDGKAKQQLEQYIADFEAKNRLKLDYDRTPWGREGEINYCFKLSTLKTKEQEHFIAGVKKTLLKATLVRYKENSVCLP